ncbi:MAG: class I SAM-dependent methyltransferase [Magnetococcales bacterium]|nr:class I SAM-dependent methyltransferase [Magnetococcales bacterium]
MARFDGFKKTGIDAEIEARLRDHCAKHQITPMEAAQHFPVLGRRQWLKRFLAHTDLFKETLEVPGDIAELGVFRGLGLMTWANLLEAYAIGDRTKTVYGFDNWQGFTHFSPEDGDTEKDANKVVGGFSPAQYLQELREAIDIFDDDRFIPWKPRVKLVDGQIEQSVPKFLDENPGVRFSLIHFDCDLYQPTRVALEGFWPRLSRGGILLFDEYAIKDWPGETRAVDEFFADKPEVIIKTLPWTNTPAGYLVKP